MAYIEFKRKEFFFIDERTLAHVVEDCDVIVVIINILGDI